MSTVEIDTPTEDWAAARGLTVGVSPFVLNLPGELAAAFVSALGDLSDVARSRVADTGSYTYRFVELADVLEVVRPILSTYGLAHLQLVDTEMVDRQVSVQVRTMIMHSSGQSFVSSPLRLVVPSTDPQRIGSAITYGRRYSLMASLGIAGDDDDDGAAARQSSGSTGQRSARQPAAPTAATGRTPQEAEARELLNAAPPEVRTAIQRAFREYFGVSLSNLSKDRHAEALSFVLEQLAVPDWIEGDVAEG